MVSVYYLVVERAIIRFTYCGFHENQQTNWIVVPWRTCTNPEENPQESVTRLYIQHHRKHRAGNYFLSTQFVDGSAEADPPTVYTLFAERPTQQTRHHLHGPMEHVGPHQGFWLHPAIKKCQEKICKFFIEFHSYYIEIVIMKYTQSRAFKLIQSQCTISHYLRGIFTLPQGPFRVVMTAYNDTQIHYMNKSVASGGARGQLPTDD